MSKWTLFWDMHSGGSLKEPPFDKIYIEAPEDEAIIIFYNKFGHNPNRVSCTCCGNDYSTREEDSLEQASAFHRGCRYAYFKNGKEIDEKKARVSGKGNLPGVTSKYIEEPSKTALSFQKFMSVDKYVKQKTVLVIYDKDIKLSERSGNVPEQGYVWQD